MNVVARWAIHYTLEERKRSKVSSNDSLSRHLIIFASIQFGLIIKNIIIYKQHHHHVEALGICST